MGTHADAPRLQKSSLGVVTVSSSDRGTVSGDSLTGVVDRRWDGVLVRRRDDDAGECDCVLVRRRHSVSAERIRPAR